MTRASLLPEKAIFAAWESTSVVAKHWHRLTSHDRAGRLYSGFARGRVGPLELASHHFKDRFRISSIHSAFPASIPHFQHPFRISSIHFADA